METHGIGKGRLYAKMAAVMGELEWVPKRGMNTHFNFKYAEASDVKDNVRRAMAKHGLAIFPHVRQIEREAKTTKVTLDFTLACGETGETLTVAWYGEAQDTGDKGFNKAMTSALKYFLIDTFLVPTGDEPDPDAEAGDGGGGGSVGEGKTGAEVPELAAARATMRQLVTQCVGKGPASVATMDALETALGQLGWGDPKAAVADVVWAFLPGSNRAKKILLEAEALALCEFLKSPEAPAVIDAIWPAESPEQAAA